jgi:hypothetical protein
MRNLKFKEVRPQLCAGFDSKAEYGRTALHFAAENGRLETFKILLKFGASIDSQDGYGRTALHIACKAGHEQIVEALLEHGSDINIMTKNNETPLDFAMAGVRSFCEKVNSYSDHYYDYDHDYYYDHDHDYYDHDSDDYYDHDSDGYFHHGRGIRRFNITGGRYDYSDDDDYVHGRGICACERIAEILRYHIVKMETANLFLSEKNLLSISGNFKLSVFKIECEEEIASMKREKFSNANISFYDILTKDTSQLAVYAGNESIVQILRSDDYKVKFPIYASMINCNFRKGERRKDLLEQGNKIFHSLSNNFPQLPHDCTEKIFSYLSDEDLRILIDACKPVTVSSPNTDINNVVVT